MLALLAFAFVAGIITILSPCILPVLPIVLAGSVTGGHRRPLGIITGFVLSFTFFTLFAFAIVSVLGLGGDTLRTVAIVILGVFGLTLVVPQASDLAKKYFSKLANVSSGNASAKREGFGGGFVVGLSLGLIWTPCVGPIMSAVITLAATSSVSWQAALIALTYSIGTAIPMFAIMIGGRKLLTRIPWLLENTEKVQKAFGIIMILIALAMAFGYDRKFQTFILDRFPSYGTGLTSFEDNETVKRQIEELDGMPTPGTQPTPMPGTMLDLTRYPAAPNSTFTGATKWLNSEPLTLEKLKGKVVLVDFWTYTCINCIRTLPYLTSWDAKYKDQGLVIVGVHAPEFAFEKEEGNVRTAMKEYGINYPVVQDNDFNIWKSYKNRYWPAKYLIDAQGRVRDTHFGEGAYEETERRIQELLKEAGMANVNKEVTKETPTKKTTSITPETYLGLARMEGFKKITGIAPSETVQDFGDTELISEETHKLKRSEFILGGKWAFDAERAMPKAGAKLSFTVKAKEVYLVMRPVNKGSRPKVGIGTGFWFPGADVKSNQSAPGGAYVEVDEDRLYHLVQIPKENTEIEDFNFTLDFPDDGIELYAFTFG